MSALELGLPAPAPEAGLPQQVTIWEMAPRDGLQAEAQQISVDTKIDLVRRLAAAGMPVIEAGSFVRPDRVPPMAGSEDVLLGVRDVAARTPVLVPNAKGFERAVAAGAQEIAVFLSVTESFSSANLSVDRGTAEARAMEVVREARATGLPVRGYLSMVFGDPWEGPVATGEVVRLASEMVEWGVDELSLGDTIGVATPGLVKETLAALTAAGIPIDMLGLHMHDTYGQALANVYAGLQSGVRIFDASVAGVGGCPFAKSATGNLATEDLVWMLNGLGIKTGIDLTALLQISPWLSSALDRPITSRVAIAFLGEDAK
ncbi:MULTISPECIES: hydroxymethylglutaryl-CoA lyase [Brachybacterium]|uniref:Hydroxymethylglutaryl-CoA lyase n=2 Tax=Brachybacterium TaxID=43668 RepID=A0A426SMY4_9MICO|nr:MULTISPECIES: hydroxymethylglutaryl-CoA lyase [Brachybacterium]MCT1437600.1 hydroxymethylglutaryl-CoA lyase [Brachybacterium paraconglomeratum]RRR19652.1 hydroxymethylglutaryl-CoA lyase [Brachybacterium paraconglomeratum]GLI31327.1 hydroxymethylglutaryl-CoA lyase [Brachybacterium conglomeratum]GLK04239.1 hydroxymethylglutaryl-CoA lyase [Brachybacterium conglomeratum]